MKKQALIASLSLVAFLFVLGYVLYASNPAPNVPAISIAAAGADQPFVVKLHAQWCPVCMMTKAVWSQIEKSYAGRVKLLVLDFTNDANTEASRAEAGRLGLAKFFDEYAYGTGTIVVIHGRTREVLASIHGSRDFAEYRAVIDAALQTSGTSPGGL
jgi:thiol-disulfide isomerase/thioredoxin